MENKKLKSKIAELDKSKNMSLEEFVDKTISDISKDLIQNEEQENTKKNSDSQIKYEICRGLLDYPHNLERMFPSMLVRLEARKYIESKIKDYAQIMFEEMLATNWKYVEKCLINDIEKAKDDVISSNKSKNKNEDELEFESQKAGILKLCEMHDFSYLKDRIKIQTPAEINTEEETKKKIDFFSDKLHSFQAQQFENYLSSADENKRLVLLSYIWYYSKANHEIINKYIPDEEIRLIEAVSDYTNGFQSPFIIYPEIQNAQFGHRANTPIFKKDEKDIYERFRNLQQKAMMKPDEETSINRILNEDSDMSQAERVILLIRKEKIEKVEKVEKPEKPIPSDDHEER